MLYIQIQKQHSVPKRAVNNWKAKSDSKYWLVVKNISHQEWCSVFLHFILHWCDWSAWPALNTQVKTFGVIDNKCYLSDCFFCPPQHFHISNFSHLKMKTRFLYFFFLFRNISGFISTSVSSFLLLIAIIKPKRNSNNLTPL